MSTRAIQYLKQKMIPFEVVRYDHAEKGARFAASATGYRLEATVKTLVVDLGDKRYSLVLMPGDKRLSMKRLAKVCGVKRAAMVDIPTAERITGYLVGGISPFGIRRKIPVVMDEGVLEFAKILVNAGQRGAMLMMDPIDIKKALACKVAKVAGS
ncbi:MAG: Cys-tRNA(Pro) deacylase [Deltaproteobacteria bacterium]|jgi:Cys-tRNA(Pro)/Cys-tRNA(Cys) deacylase|nr:Cys-tRNA(Pro) deacylase [Deltaproteobacteria bacterium]